MPSRAGISPNMESVITIRDVRTFETRGGNTRFVVRDDAGNEYTTFREAIGARARELEGRRVRIGYHDEQRGQYTNTYLDAVEPAREPVAQAEPEPAAAAEPDTAAWLTAVDAAPWLVGAPSSR